MFAFHTDWIEIYPGTLKEFVFTSERTEMQGNVLKEQYKDDRLGAFSILYQKPNYKACCG